MGQLKEKETIIEQYMGQLSEKDKAKLEAEMRARQAEEVPAQYEWVSENVLVEPAHTVVM